MNKKYLLFGLVVLSCITAVSAIAYYAMFSASFTINQAVYITGENEQHLGDIYAGDKVDGETITISNDAPSIRVVRIQNDAEDDIEVEYVSKLELSQKIVDFNSNKWELTGDTAIVEYTIYGDKFSAKVIEGEKEGYVLVYYKDNSDRFNSPAKAILIEDVNGNMPYEEDKNKDEYDYCETNEYNTCHGAKIWYVPLNAIDSEGNIDWTMSDSFLFETSLIQYSDDGELILYPESSIDIKPIYYTSFYSSGEKIITTTII